MPLLSLYRYKVTKYTNIPDLISNLKSKKKRKKKNKKKRKNRKKMKKNRKKKRRNRKKKKEIEKKRKKEIEKKKEIENVCFFQFPVSREEFSQISISIRFQGFPPTSNFLLSAFSFQFSASLLI